MFKNAIIIMLLTAQLLEILYILFRNPKLNYFNIFIYALCIVLSTSLIIDSFTLLNFVKLISIITLFSAKRFLKNKPFEKPDYRYLIILIGTIAIQLI